MQNPALLGIGLGALVAGLVLMGVWISLVLRVLQALLPVALIGVGITLVLRGMGKTWSEVGRQVIQGLQVVPAGSGTPCPNCQRRNPPGARFCGQCGSALGVHS
jgi:multisubunit Na+/H+ antiporter MnhC subunit